MESFLHSIERESAKNNMKLNKQKCVVLNMNEIMRVEYSGGTQVPEKNQTVYLGAVITKKFEYKPELNHRIAATAKVMNNLSSGSVHLLAPNGRPEYLMQCVWQN